MIIGGRRVLVDIDAPLRTRQNIAFSPQYPLSQSWTRLVTKTLLFAELLSFQ